MPYFDFHLHPAFKKFICKFESAYPSQRSAQDLQGEIDMKNPITDFLEEEFLHILESQSCMNQLRSGDFVLGVANIAPIEEMFTARDSFFGKILNSQFFTSPVDQKYFDLIRAREISYYQLLIRELSLYKSLRDAGIIEILSRKTGITPADTAVKKISLAIGIEGGHSLCRTRIKRPGVPDTLVVTKHDALSRDFMNHSVLTPADSLRHLQNALWKEGMDICYLILTHLSYIGEQPLATHAFGMKMIKHDAVYPRGNGITQGGKEVIDAAYTMTVKNDDDGKDIPAPILIDIKHMGLKSRLDFYAYRREKGYDKYPILASHMGVTGYSIEEWKAALDEARLVQENDIPVAGVTIDRKRAGEWGFLNKTFTYNAWSINMMDEDIEAVLNSGGLIGISLDVRILGWQNILGKGDKEEFLSWEDFRYFFPEKFSKLSKDKKIFEESFFKPTQEERHPLAMCFNILHIVAVGKMFTNVDPWKSICVGSDFDGLINPLINCRDASKFPTLEKNLLKWLPVAEEAYRKENGGDALLPRTDKDKIDQAALRTIVSDIVVENGKRFMNQWKGGFIGSTPPTLPGVAEKLVEA
jgi:hypothetical protein